MFWFVFWIPQSGAICFYELSYTKLILECFYSKLKSLVFLDKVRIILFRRFSKFFISVLKYSWSRQSKFSFSFESNALYYRNLNEIFSEIPSLKKFNVTSMTSTSVLVFFLRFEAFERQFGQECLHFNHFSMQSKLDKL